MRRDSLPGPGTISTDLSLTKETKITEKLNMEFRVEAYNFINHWNVGGQYAGVLGGIDSPTAGTTTSSQSPVITPRQIEFALKFDF